MNWNSRGSSHLSHGLSKGFDRGGSALDADEVSQKVVEEYFPVFKRLKQIFEGLLEKEGFA